ncbi:MAG: ACP S-malonyltransferase [Lachnospiraceae bacterium]|nr:ACP S-malonyltransferase [Lachnospiraceae bacterium]
MKLGFVYAGQGSQKVGMGKDFYDSYDTFKETFDGADEIVTNKTKCSIKELCFDGPEDKLSETRYTQPAMVSYAIGVTKLLQNKGISPDYVCGLSLGEYSALYAAGVLDEKTVLDIVAIRGKVMSEASAGKPVKMAAVINTTRNTVIDCCKQATEEFDGLKIVEAANFNCPGQIVISGDEEAVDRASVLLTEAGARRILPLKVSGPFHTSLMKPAGDKLRTELDKISFAEARARVIFNCLGREMEPTDDIANLLERQVQSSVYLEDSIRYMAEAGVDTIVEIGPGNVIGKFIKKTAPEIKVISIDTVEDYEAAVKELTA